MSDSKRNVNIFTAIRRQQNGCLNVQKHWWHASGILSPFLTLLLNAFVRQDMFFNWQSVPLNYGKFTNSMPKVLAILFDSTIIHCNRYCRLCMCFNIYNSFSLVASWCSHSYPLDSYKNRHQNLDFCLWQSVQLYLWTLHWFI